MTETQKNKLYMALSDKELSAETKREILTKLGFSPETSRPTIELENLWIANTPDSKSKIQDAYKVLKPKKMSMDIPPSLRRHHAIQKKGSAERKIHEAIVAAQLIQKEKESKRAAAAARAAAKSGETATGSTSTSHMVHDVQNLQGQLLLENLDNVQLWINMIQLANTKYHEKVNKDKATRDILKLQTNHGTVAEKRAYKAIVANLTNQDEKDAAIKKYEEKLAEYRELNGIQKNNAYLLDVVDTDEFTRLSTDKKKKIAEALLWVVMKGGRKKRKTKKRKGGKKKRKTRKKKVNKRKTRRKLYKKKKSSRKTKRRR
jgi:hypothetical protein